MLRRRPGAAPGSTVNAPGSTVNKRRQALTNISSLLRIQVPIRCSLSGPVDDRDGPARLCCPGPKHASDSGSPAERTSNFKLPVIDSDHDRDSVESLA